MALSAIEGVWFLHDAVALQKIRFRRKCEAINLAAQAREAHAELHGVWSERPIPLIGIHAELGFDAGLEDRDLDREIAVTQHASIVRAAFVLGFGVFALLGIWRAAARDHRRCKCKRCRKAEEAGGHLHG